VVSPQQTENTGLWEASKEKAKDAYNYTSQSAHNLGVKIGIVEPTVEDKFAQKTHEAGVKMGLEEPTTTEKIQDSAHRTGVRTGVVEPTPAEKWQDPAYYRTPGVNPAVVEPIPGEKFQDPVYYRTPGVTEPISVEKPYPYEKPHTGYFTDPMYTEKIKDAAHNLGVKIGIVNPTPEEKAAEEAHKALVEPTMGEKVKGTMENAGEKAKEKAHQAGLKMGVTEPTVAEKASEAAHKAGVKLGVAEPTTGEKIKGTMENVGEIAKEKANEAKFKAMETKEEERLRAQKLGAMGVEDTPVVQPTNRKFIE
jgi:hypothetical protein